MNNNTKSPTSPLGIKKQRLSAIVDALLSQKRATRASIAKTAEVSTTTVGKVISALVQAKLLEEISRPVCDGRQKATSCAHYSPVSTLRTAVVDLSSSHFSLHLILGDTQCLGSFIYDYQSELSLYDNLILFFSQAINRNRKVCRSAYAVTVILADTQSSPCEPGNLAVISALPTERDRSTIQSLIVRLIGDIPIRFTFTSNALVDAIRFNVCDGLSGGGIAYLRLGRQTLAIGYRQGYEPLILHPDLLLKNDSQTFAQALMAQPFGALSPAEQSEFIMRAVNLVCCVIHADSYVFESEDFHFNSLALAAVKRAFALISAPLPNVIARCSAPSLLCLGAAKAALSDHLCEFLTKDEQL